MKLVRERPEQAPLAIPPTPPMSARLQRQRPGRLNIVARQKITPESLSEGASAVSDAEDVFRVVMEAVLLSQRDPESWTQGLAGRLLGK